MDLPAEMCLESLGLTSDTEGMVRRIGQKYAIDAEGAIAWRKSSTITTYHIMSMEALADYVSFEKQSFASGAPVFGSSKGVVVRREGVKVVCTLIPPFIVEKCHRSHGRL
eukprot:862292-Pleurochrysis_carterae.AAC.1